MGLDPHLTRDASFVWFSLLLAFAKCTGDGSLTAWWRCAIELLVQRSQISVKGIATGICQIYQGQHQQKPAVAGGLLDIDLLANAITCPYPSEHAKCQITEVCMGGRVPSAKTAGNAGREAKSGGGARPNASNRLNNVCAFKMRVLGGGDNVTLRIWANCKTQTSGCKDRDMLIMVNETICHAVRQISESNMAQNIPGVIRGDAALQKEVLSELPNIKVLSAHILGSWNLDLRSVGVKLDMGNLCEFLSGERFCDRVFKVCLSPPLCACPHVCAAGLPWSGSGATDLFVCGSSAMVAAG